MRERFGAMAMGLRPVRERVEAVLGVESFFKKNFKMADDSLMAELALK